MPTFYTFDVNRIFPFQREPNMVDLYDAAPKLMMSTTEDCPAKSRWFYQVNESYGSFNPTPSAQAKVNELVKEAKNEMEKIAILTHWIADNMHYSGISMGKGEGYTLHFSKLDKQENLKGELILEAGGQSDGAIRRIFTAGFQRDWKNKLEKELLQVSPQARLLQVDYGQDPRDYQSAPLRIKMKFYTSGFAIAGKLPKEFRIQNTREDNTKNSVGRFSGSLQQKKQQLILMNKLSSGKRVYETSDWSAFREAVNRHKSYEANILLQR